MKKENSNLLIAVVIGLAVITLYVTAVRILT